MEVLPFFPTKDVNQHDNCDFDNHCSPIAASPHTQSHSSSRDSSPFKTADNHDSNDNNDDDNKNNNTGDDDYVACNPGRERSQTTIIHKNEYDNSLDIALDDASFKAINTDTETQSAHRRHCHHHHNQHQQRRNHKNCQRQNRVKSGLLSERSSSSSSWSSSKSLLRPATRPPTPPPESQKEYPLVLLHCTLLPPSLFLTCSDESIHNHNYHHHHLHHRQPSETILKDVLPPSYWKRWKLLEDNVLASEFLRERGVLISHPHGAYDVLEERLLESLGLVLDTDADGVDADTSEMWNIRVYAANGLMGAGAWTAAWKEMEKVDVEIGMHLPVDIKREIERRMQRELEQDLERETNRERAQYSFDKVNEINSSPISSHVESAPQPTPMTMPRSPSPWESSLCSLSGMGNNTLVLLGGVAVALLLGAAIVRPRIVGYLLNAVTTFDADITATTAAAAGGTNEPPPCAILNQGPPCAFVPPSTHHMFSSRQQC